MKPYIFLAYLVWSLLSCSSQSIDLGVAKRYHPPAKAYQDGIVYKYYIHAIPTNKDKISSTNIQYLKFKSQGTNFLLCDATNAAFQPIWHKKTQIENGKMLTKDFYRIFKGDTCQTTIRENAEFDWNNGAAVLNSSLYFEKADTKINIINKQVSVTDTLVENLPTKHFQKIIENQVITATDTTNYTSEESRIYAKGIGLYSIWIKTDQTHFHHELIEQMSIGEYEKRKAKAKKRIAYIDPNESMSQDENFKICNKEKNIGDYYGRENPCQLKGGKGSWWRILKKELKPALLHEESGYLTYRFVVNCEGESGRFITEQTGLDFKKKKFNDETIDHLFQIVADQKDWQIGIVQDKTVDSYVYITFKLKDGKVIEILP